jgi:thiamine pyrophosphokinase
MNLPSSLADIQYDLLLIGGLSGRVDQTVHVMSLLHKLRKTRPRSFILSSESLAWVLDEVCCHNRNV